MQHKVNSLKNNRCRDQNLITVYVPWYVSSPIQHNAMWRDSLHKKNHTRAMPRLPQISNSTCSSCVYTSQGLNYSTTSISNPPSIQGQQSDVSHKQRGVRYLVQHHPQQCSWAGVAGKLPCRDGTPFWLPCFAHPAACSHPVEMNLQEGAGQRWEHQLMVHLWCQQHFLLRVHQTCQGLQHEPCQPVI